MSDLYTKHALKYAEVVKNNIYNAFLERPSTLALLDNVSGKDVLDIGCGSGEYADWFEQHAVKQLTCVDVSEEMISMVKDKLGPSVTAYTHDISAGLPRELDNSADIIICPLVLHYIKELSPVFKDVHRVLKPGGYMVFSTHHPFADFECSKNGNYFEREYIQESWDTVGAPVEVSFYRRSLTEICDAIHGAGLHISRMTEGQVDEKAKEISESTYLHLKNNPNFIFIRCEKLSA